jgi:hypothetical protein
MDAITLARPHVVHPLYTKEIAQLAMMGRDIIREKKEYLEEKYKIDIIEILRYTRENMLVLFYLLHDCSPSEYYGKIAEEEKKRRDAYFGEQAQQQQ